MRLFVDDSPQKKVLFPTLSVLESSILSLSTTGESWVDEKLKVDMIVIGSVANDPKTGARLGKGESILIGACRRLVELLLHTSPSVLIPALRMVGNIVTGFDRHTQCIIELQVLPCLMNLLTQNHKKSIKKEACCTISNITAGNNDQIQVVYIMFLRYFVAQGCIKPLCDLLIYLDTRIVTVCLDGLENILKVGEAEKTMGNTDSVNLYSQKIDKAEGLENIENLQSHDNTEIYEKVEEDEMPPPGDADQTEFHFVGTHPQLRSGGFNFG
ncbi:hypothetical protein MKW98_000267 [Papaver atlanticum]|uniref:Uncharacterized protein n=1 Tax=Papaver atlanticum TaxID=357466 RepID=A0AAD4X5P2_9MAGN|nr:hypothetical protein MKW98_000267 [Papaver atlanticum]